MKFAFIGAGSFGFTRRLIGDILLDPTFSDSEFALMDVDPEKLGVMERIVRRMIMENGRRAKVYATHERREALRGADIVVVTVRVGELEDIRADHLIPAQHGMRQTVADTVGPGGVFYGIRNIAVLQGVCEDMEAVAPRAFLLNYTNPMAIAMSVLQRSSPVKSIGLCHSVQHTLEHLCRILGVEKDDVTYTCAGVNHTAWFYELRQGETDLYPRLHARAQDPEVFAKDPVRFDLMQRFHYFPTESSRHHAEYHPYYLHRDDEVRRLSLTYNNGVQRFTPEEHGKKTIEALREFEQREDIAVLKTSAEYFLPIAKALALDTPFRAYGSVLNRGLIPQLPPECAAEVPVYVDRTGFRPTAAPMPAGGALARTAAVAHHQFLAAEGILRRDLRLVREAILCDPNTSASLSVRDIEAMTDKLIEQNQAYLKGYVDSRHSVYMGGGPAVGAQGEAS